MKRLLIMSTALDIGGVQKSLLSLLQALDYREFSVDLLLLDEGGEFMTYLPAQVRVIKFPPKHQWVYLPRGQVLTSFLQAIGPNLNVFRYIFFLLKGLLIGNMGQARQQLMRAAAHTLPGIPGNYDAAIDYTGGHKGYILAKTQAKKKLSWVHGDYRVFRRDRKIDLDEYARIDAIITVSETCLHIIAEEFPQFSSKCHIMPNIISKKSIEQLALSPIENMQDEPHTYKILDITRLDPDKGLELAAEACKELTHRGYEIHWYVLGEGPERQRLQSYIDQLGISDRFTLLGSRQNPYPYIRQADFIVHCSKFEGRSVAIDEAMLLGKPIVLTDYATAKDQIDSEVNGLICAMNKEGIFAAVKRLIDEPELAEKFMANLESYDIPPEASIDKLRSMLG